ncbi:MAG: hypothetical protein DHS20C14_07020 [Phycisphaeraceae bacterium]|nr:MAG: hypothetical protein DHS20C14_07020 [Phycisphaeraceae bacterium]
MDTKRFIGLAGGIALGGSVCQGAVGVVGGVLEVTTSDVDQSLIVLVGPTAGEVRVLGLAGFPGGASYTGLTGIDFTTGLGDDTVIVGVTSDEDFDVRVHTRAGEADVVVTWFIPPDSTDVMCGIDVLSAKGPDQYTRVEVETHADNTLIDINTGNSTEVDINVDAPDTAVSLDLAVVARGALTTVDVVAAALFMDVALGGGFRGTDDTATYTLTQTIPGSMTVDAGMKFWGGDDDVTATISSTNGTVTLEGVINASGGDDSVTVDVDASRTMSSLKLKGAGGADELTLLTRGEYKLSSDRTIILGNSGDDTLMLRSLGGVTGTGEAGTRLPLTNGGPGIDLYDAFGAVSNCESTF